MIYASFSLMGIRLADNELLMFLIGLFKTRLLIPSLYKPFALGKQSPRSQLRLYD